MTAAPVSTFASLPKNTNGADPAIDPPRGLLVDPRGRRMRKLRLSITDRCDLGCLYCQPVGATCGSAATELAPAEIAGIVGTLVDCGIDTLRLTGGEPLLRNDLEAVLEALAPFPIAKAITTNGQILSQHARLLARSGFRTVNVSVDSLDPGRFRNITKTGSLQKAMDGILAARAEGMEVKINCVILRGVNDDEIGAFHDLSASTGIEVRFLELLAAGPGKDLQPRHFLSSRETRGILERHSGVLVDLPSPPDSTVRRALSPTGARIGFMSSESEPFCRTCSRLRISAAGILHPCLFRDDGVDLRGADAEEIVYRVRSVLALKPERRPDEISRSMRNLGG